MYALWKTQGVTVRPWRADVRFGAAREGGTLCLGLTADQPWDGRVVFDQPRHKLLMRLPLDYARINQFPEWFTVEKDANYRVRLDRARGREQTGAHLAEGFPVTLLPGQVALLVVSPR